MKRKKYIYIIKTEGGGNFHFPSALTFIPRKEPHPQLVGPHKKKLENNKKSMIPLPSFSTQQSNRIPAVGVLITSPPPMINGPD